MTVVLITGAAQGLGREVARRLAATDHTVFVSARDLEKAQRTAGELDGDVRALPVGLDVNDDASVRAAAAALDRLDVLVNNAAAYVNWGELPSGVDLGAAHAALETNLFGAAVRPRHESLRERRRRERARPQDHRGKHGLNGQT